MNNEILFRNGANEEAVYDHQYLIDNIKDYIQMVDKYVKKNMHSSVRDDFNKYCYLFSKAIIEYAKESFNSIVTGSFYAFTTLTRTIVENYVCLRVIKDNPDKELWKYWVIHSHCQKLLVIDCENIKDRVKEVCESFGVDISIVNDKFIKNNFGWCFPLMKNPNMKTLSQSVDQEIYKDYQILCEYSHGVSLYQKQMTFTFYDEVLSMFFKLFYYVDKFFDYMYEEIADEEDINLKYNIYKIFENLFKN